MEAADRLAQAIEKAGLTQAELEQISGYHSGYLSKIIHRKRPFSPKLAARLAPFLNVPTEWILTGEGADEPAAVDLRRMLRNVGFAGEREVGAMPPRSYLDGSESPWLVPVVDMASLAEFEPSLHTIGEYMSEHAEDRIPFPKAQQGDVVVRIVDQSMEPCYAKDTLILARPGEAPQNGDSVFARLDNGVLVLMEFQRKDDTVRLKKLKGVAGDSITWKIKEEPGRIQWMWSVVSSLHYERAHRGSSESAGG